MILIGKYNGPLVRPVGIALRLCGIAFGRRPRSAFGDAGKIGAFKPLMRVPAFREIQQRFTFTPPKA